MQSKPDLTQNKSAKELLVELPSVVPTWARTGNQQKANADIHDFKSASNCQGQVFDGLLLVKTWIQKQESM